MQAHELPQRHLQVVPSPPAVSVTDKRGTIKREAHRHRRQMMRRRRRETLIELGVKITVNLTVVAVAGTTMMRLWDYHSVQRSRLAEAQQELQDAEQRFELAQDNFSRHFDPQQAGSIMQEQANRLSPEQRQIVWVDRYSTTNSH